jgi:sulfur carrier protein
MRSRRSHVGSAARCDVLGDGTLVPMQVHLRNPSRVIEIDGRRKVHALLVELGLNRESHLVIRNGTLVPGDGELGADDVIEIRPVISGGA